MSKNIVKIKPISLFVIEGTICIQVDKTTETENLIAGDQIIVNGKYLTLSRAAITTGINGKTLALPVYSDEVFHAYIA
jgi:hypothetical protein